jgi:hypothetical protein
MEVKTLLKILIFLVCVNLIVLFILIYWIYNMHLSLNSVASLFAETSNQFVELVQILKKILLK